MISDEDGAYVIVLPVTCSFPRSTRERTTCLFFGFAGAFHLAQLYQFGNGVPQDCDVAHDWYEEAANANNSNAMLALGDLYSEGCVGFRDDREKAREWYTKAAQAGNVQANEKLRALK